LIHARAGSSFTIGTPRSWSERSTRRAGGSANALARLLLIGWLRTGHARCNHRIACRIFWPFLQHRHRTSRTSRSWCLGTRCRLSRRSIFRRHPFSPHLRRSMPPMTQGSGAKPPSVTRVASHPVRVASSASSGEPSGQPIRASAHSTSRACMWPAGVCSSSAQAGVKCRERLRVAA
jgi:hypothetical protein